MGVKVHRKGIIVANQMAFVVLSLVYLQVVMAIDGGYSAFHRESFLGLIKLNPQVLFLGIGTIVFTYLAKAPAKIFFALYSGWIAFLSIKVFIGNLDKLILILNFIYILLSYYLFVIFSLELKRSLYHPRFIANAIGAKCEQGIGVSIAGDKGKAKGYLSNWDGESCFIILQREGRKKPIRGEVEISISFEGQLFSFQGQVRSSIGQGVGVEVILKSEEEGLGWPEFYEIINSRGLYPWIRT